MKKPANNQMQAGLFGGVDDLDFTAKPPKYHGTDNPRELRLLHLLLRRPSASRDQIASEVGAINVPDLVLRVRENGLGEHLACRRISVIDRDGQTCRPGVWYLTPAGRKAIYRWFAERGNVGASDLR